jgi:AcrR family transcriptional regulator
MTDRRQELAEAATDYVLEHGLIGLTLRPLAAAIGTSDRMLLYHFRDKDDLVATVLRTSNDRSVTAIRALRAASDPERAVLDLWSMVNSHPIRDCARMYAEASALGVLGREPYAGVITGANVDWISAVADHLVSSGLPRTSARRAATLVDATFIGLQLDQDLDDGDAQRRTAHDLANAVAALWAVPSAAPARR